MVRYERSGGKFFRIIYDCINYKTWMHKLEQEERLRVMKFKDIKREQISEKEYRWGELGGEPISHTLPPECY